MGPSVADYGVGSLPIHARMLFEEIRLADHVVINEEEYLSIGFGCAAVPGRAGSSILLFDDAHREWTFKFGESRCGAVRGAVDNNDDFNRARIGQRK